MKHSFLRFLSNTFYFHPLSNNPQHHDLKRIFDHEQNLYTRMWGERESPLEEKMKRTLNIYSVVYISESGSAWKAPALLLVLRERFPSLSLRLYAGNSKQLLKNLHHWVDLDIPYITYIHHNPTWIEAELSHYFDWGPTFYLRGRINGSVKPLSGEF